MIKGKDLRLRIEENGKIMLVVTAIPSAPSAWTNSKRSFETVGA